MSLSTLKPRVKAIDTRQGSSAATPRIRGAKHARIRNRILNRDEYTCKQCGAVSTRLVIDHIVPLHLGGSESDSNRQALCRWCHDQKTAREERERSGQGVGGGRISTESLAK